MLIDGGFYSLAASVSRLLEISLESLRNIERGIVQSSEEELLRLRVIEPKSHLPIELASKLNNLSGVTHAFILLLRVGLFQRRRRTTFLRYG